MLRKKTMKDGLQKVKDPHWFCCDCHKEYTPDGQQRENWAWKKNEDGEFVKKKRKAPWRDFSGKDIYEGDTILHPSLEEGIVIYTETEPAVADRWRVVYAHGQGVARLSLQVGDKCMAIVVNK